MQKRSTGMLGHHSAAFTLDTYTHVTEQKKKVSAEKIGIFHERKMSMCRSMSPLTAECSSNMMFLDLTLQLPNLVEFDRFRSNLAVDIEQGKGTLKSVISESLSMVRVVRLERTVSWSQTRRYQLRYTRMHYIIITGQNACPVPSI